MGFSAEFTAARKAVMQRKSVAARKATMELFQRVISASPIDTGRFAGNWICSQNTPSDDEIIADNGAGAMQYALSRMQSEMAAVPDPLAMDVWLVNNLPYAAELEYGSSKQAPNGMVRLNVQKFPSIFAKYLRSG